MTTRKQHDHDHDDEEAPSGRMPELMDEHGPIWVNKFTEDSARAFVKQLQFQSRQDQASPIIIYIDSNGGEAYALLTMIAAMESVPNQIITCALSKAMSAGVMLLACGDIRYACEHATLMVHEVSAGTGGHIDDIQTQHVNITKLNDKLLKLFVKKCNFKGGVVALKKMLSGQRDLYLTAEEGQKLGVVHHIGIPTLYKNLSVEYTLSSNPRGQHGVSKAKD